MKTTDGFSLATAAAALLMSGSSLAQLSADQTNPDDPVKISVCQNAHAAGQSACKGFGNDAGAGANSCGAMGFVAITTGNSAFSSAMCQVVGGTEAASLTAAAEFTLSDNAVSVAYCNDVFTCAGLSACKGNNNAAGAGKNSCHGIGFIGIYSGSAELSESLCAKLGGTVLSAGEFASLDASVTTEH
jgi:hypothetical protein